VNRASPRRRGEHGAASVIAVGLLAVLVLTAVASSGSVAIIVTHRRAQSAADLAALAAAQALQRGSDPCAAGAAIARAQDADLTGCTVEGPEVVVIASLRMPPALGGSTIAGRARAGPGPPH
jgi:secretion/DNA translocation related TadE-like protein